MIAVQLFFVKFISFIAVVYSFHINNQNIDIKERIVEGEVIDVTQLPYTAFLYYIYEDPSHIFTATCTAVIISETWILTAAHCVKHPETMWVYSGAPSTENRISPTHPVNRHVISKVIPHEGYHEFPGPETPPLNDIALIKLVEPIEFDEYRKSILIATESDLLQSGKEVLVSGYGRIRNDEVGVFGKPLKRINETVLPQEKCQEAYPNDDVSSFFCTEAVEGGACEGDSGGPAVIDGKLVGIMSFGYREYCNTKFGPELYTRLHLYRDWIDRKMNESLD